MHIAILGTGHMATALGGSLTAAGHTVTFGSRDPQAHTELGSVTQMRAAIADSDLVINALTAAFSLEVLTPLADVLDGRVLLDIGNAINERFELLYPTTSIGAKLQEALPGTRVVKSLNTLTGAVAVAPDTLPAATNVFLSGNDEGAKALVSGLLVELGWPVSQQIDLGGIDSARGPEHYFILFATMFSAFGTPMFNIAVVR